METELEVAIGEVQAGDRLAADLKDEGGRPLVRAGVVLNGALVRRLMQKGVQTVRVYRTEALSATEREARLVALRQQIDQLFIDVEGTELMAEFKAMLLRYHGRSLASDGEAR